MGRPWTFEQEFVVPAADIDRQGHVNNVVYLRYAQDAAVAHWEAAVPPEDRQGLAWVVRRHEIDYLRPAHEGDALVARTWIGEVGAASMDRLVEIRRAAGGEVLARVRTVWVAVDAGTMRPRRIAPGIRDRFLEPDEAPGGADPA
ncbi:Acyl-ACP thioesterase [Aquisphaera giovannonii]|uniref:Acyl-ACP thioesterase n=1 Tax=Aquisphaera giovannonii TaxID=406548 RepID=A0A5B9W1K3_9BACT|nr:thioesterase family protein [Aquisphaera giovannonii]QEH34532.1 Acyl-ACP thioesterase [Aquisphaera giovannonii]